MSYLLDALQKSEQERRRQQTPDLNQPAAPGTHREARHGRRWLWIGLAVVLNLAALAALWVWQADNADMATSASPLPPAGADRQEQAPAEHNVTATPERVTTDAARPDRTTADEKAATPTAAAGTGVTPPLVLHAHIYADNARYREVSINGSFYRIGDRIGELEVVDITPGGVVLERNGETIELGVGDQWP